MPSFVDDAAPASESPEAPDPYTRTTMNTFPPGFAVLDIETTGLRSASDRAIEIAVVRLDAAGEPVSELSTLLNPDYRMGATHIHGLKSEDLEGAPRFAEVLPELVRYLKDAALVGHNVKFDASFLSAELSRAGYALPHAPLLCTRDMAMRSLPSLGEYRLSAVCRALGIPMTGEGQEHQALFDARVAAAVFRRLKEDEPFASWIAEDLRRAPRVEWPKLEGTARLLPRSEAVANKAAEVPAISLALSGLAEGASGAPLEGYFVLLDEMLDDRRVTDEDGQKLAAFASSAGLLRGDLSRAHRSYLTGLARTLLAGDVAGGVGAADLENVARLLGLPQGASAEALAAAKTDVPAPVPSSTRPLRAGMAVCFSGDGTPPKDELEQRARDFGLRVASGVSKKLDAVILDDPFSMTSKAQKARSYGLRILAIPVFLSLVSGASGGSDKV